MPYLITGGAGFIGSHLAEQLLDADQEVIVLDDLSTGSMRNIEHLKSRPGFRCVVDSVTNEPLVGELMEECRIVFHLAAAVGVKLIVESPVRTLETNIQGTEIVLRQANRKKRKVLLTSTSEVYGKSSDIPFREDADIVLGPTTRARWAYACSKAVDEFLALAYAREKGLPVVVARLFNTVGPRQVGRYGMVVPTFVRQALMGQPVTVYGDGYQRRCFMHVADAVNALAKLARQPRAVGRVLNIGSTEEISMRELAGLVIQMTGSPSQIVHVPYDRAYAEGFEDMARRVPALDAVCELIDFKPSRGIKDIIKDVMAHMQE